MGGRRRATTRKLSGRNHPSPVTRHPSHCVISWKNSLFVFAFFIWLFGYILSELLRDAALSAAVNSFLTDFQNSFFISFCLVLALTFFALTARGLACTGIYGTLSYAVSLRRREVAVRLALGAVRRTVMHQLMTTSVRVVGAAAACGMVLALLFAQTLSTMLYGVSPADPVTLTGVLIVVVTVAGLAALIPAARATFGQPMRALRED